MKILIVSLFIAFGFDAHAQCNYQKLGYGGKGLFRQFIKTLQAADTPNKFSALVKFPMKLNIRPDRIVVKDKAELRKHFKTIMSDEVKKAIKYADPNTAFCSREGLALERGKVWFVYEDEKYRIFAVNP